MARQHLPLCNITSASKGEKKRVLSPQLFICSTIAALLYNILLLIAVSLLKIESHTLDSLVSVLLSLAVPVTAAMCFVALCGILWAPFAAFITGLIAHRLGLRSVVYAGAGAFYSILSPVIWLGYSSELRCHRLSMRELQAAYSLLFLLWGLGPMGLSAALWVGFLTAEPDSLLVGSPEVYGVIWGFVAGLWWIALWGVFIRLRKGDGVAGFSAGHPDPALRLAAPFPLGAACACLSLYSLVRIIV